VHYTSSEFYFLLKMCVYLVHYLFHDGSDIDRVLSGQVNTRDRVRVDEGGSNTIFVCMYCMYGVDDE
jgi:hypothetical protein